MTVLAVMVMILATIGMNVLAMIMMTMVIIDDCGGGDSDDAGMTLYDHSEHKRRECREEEV